MEARGEDSGASSDSHVSATPTKPGSLRSCLRDTAASGGMRATSPSRAPPGLPSPQGSSNPHLRRAPARVALAERLAPNRPAERKPEEGASTAGARACVDMTFVVATVAVVACCYCMIYVFLCKVCIYDTMVG